MLEQQPLDEVLSMDVTHEFIRQAVEFSLRRLNQYGRENIRVPLRVIGIEQGGDETPAPKLYRIIFREDAK